MSYPSDTLEILHISTYDSRGAGRAAQRLNKGLQAIGLRSQMLVQVKDSDDYSVLAPQTRKDKAISKLRPSLSRLPLVLYPKRELTDYYPTWLPDSVGQRVNSLEPNIVNLHWLCDGLLEIKSLARLNRPLVWTLHDMWAFTGGCHYHQGCNRYIDKCGSCPQLASTSVQDLSRLQWQRKANVLKTLNLTVVSPSKWLAERAKASAIFRHARIEVIPNGIDTERYRPVDRQIAREILHLPQDKHLVLFGAMHAIQDKRKGFNLLQSALSELSQTRWQEQLELIVFGASQPQEPVDLGFKTHYLGKLSDDVAISLVYAAADVFVAPSIEDNLPNTVLESIACGTPCVAFNIGGMPDLIEHQKNGFLAEPYQVQELAQGIIWSIENQERHQKLRQYARQKVEAEFTLKNQASRYFDLYMDILR